MFKKFDPKKVVHKRLKKQLKLLNHHVGVNPEGYFLSLVDQTYAEYEKAADALTQQVAAGEQKIVDLKAHCQHLETENHNLSNVQKRYLLASEAAHDGLWDWDLKDQSVFFSSRFLALLELPDASQLQTFDDWVQHIHPTDRDLFQRHFQRHFDGLYPRIELECQIQKKSGDYVWVQIQGLAERHKGHATRVSGAMTDITIRKSNESALYNLAFYDELTGLANRMLFINRIEQLIEREKRLCELPGALLFIDLDNFKHINDTMGHAMGDQVLKVVSQVIRNNISPRDTAARLGSDEFTILLDVVENIEDAKRVGERLLAQLNRTYDIDGRDVHIACSIGLTLVHRCKTDAQSILRNADLAMYYAKASGKARLEIFDQEQHERLLWQMETEGDLRTALREGKLSVSYQPIINLSTGKISSFEALIRWYDPHKGYISPASFIPLAEEYGLIGQLGQEVLEQVILQIRHWIKVLGEKQCPRVGVNLSVRQVTEDRHYSLILATLAKHLDLAPYLSFEVTESLVITDSNQVRERLERIKKMGIKLCVDDFGTGYSSLSSLHSFPFDVIKIDQSFVATMLNDRKSERLIQSILALGKDLNLTVLAEGIETIEQAQKLREMGCALGQGFYFSKSLSAEEASTLLYRHDSYQFDEEQLTQEIKKTRSI